MIDKQMFCDEFIGEVIKIGRLDSFNLRIDHDTSDLTERVGAEVDLTVPVRGGIAHEARTYKGNGRSMGQALRAIREQIRVEVGY